MTGLADNFPFTGNGFPAYVGTTAPQNAMLGQIWFNPTSGATQVYTNTGWETVNASVDVQVINLNTPGGAGIGQAYINWFVVPGNVITGSLIYGLYGSPPLTYVLDNMANPSADASWIALNGSTSDTQLVALQPNAGGIGAAWAALPTPPSTPGMVTIASFQTDLYILVAEASPTLNASWSRLTGVFQAPGSGAANRILTADATGALSWLSSFSGQVNIVTTQPASPVLGTLYYDQTRTPAAVEVWNGTAWVAVDEPPKVGATAPTGPVIGSFWYDTSLTPNVMKVWNGTAWVLVAPAAGSNGQLQFNNAGAFAGAAGITTTGTEIAIASGTKTASSPAIDVTQTWNAGGVAFSGARVNVTDTASAAGSKLLDIQKTGVSQFNIDKTGQAMFGDGTAAAPAITNIGDENTGILFPAADTVAVATGGVERLRVDATGNVGIGTSPLVGILDVATRTAALNTAISFVVPDAPGVNNGATFGLRYGTNSTIRSSISIAFENLLTNFNSYITLSTGTTATPNVERMRIDPNGNIGIGTGSPQALLDVTSGIGSTRLTGHQILMTRNSNNEIYAQGASSVLALGTNSVERMRIDSAGNVGIGLSAPTDILDINGGIRRRVVSLGTSSVPASEIGIQYQFGTGTANRAGLYFLNSYNNNGAAWLSFWTSDPSNNYAERARIDQLGSLLINRTTSFAASSKIQLNTDSSVVDSLFGGQSIMAITSDTYAADLGASVGLGGRNSGGNFVVFGSVSGRSSGAGSQGYLQFATSSGSNLLERMRIDSSGNTVIGATSVTDSYRLDVVNPAGGTATLFRASNNIDAAFNINAVQSGGIQLFNRNSGYLLLGTANTERMRITSAGNVGIGTTNPAQRLGVSGRIQVDVAASAFSELQYQALYTGLTLPVVLGQGGDGSAYLINRGNVSLVLGTNDTERMRISSAGNIGIGVTPVDGYGRSIQIAQTGGSTAGLVAQAIGADNMRLDLLNNALPPAGGYTAGYNYQKTGDSATRYTQVSGQHLWATAAPGTAGNTITFTAAMTLDASGNLGVSATPGSWVSTTKAIQLGGRTSLSSNSSNNTYFGNNVVETVGGWTYIATGASSLFAVEGGNVYKWYQAASGTAGTAASFTQTMTLTAAGRLGIGTTSPVSTLHVSGGNAYVTGGDVMLATAGKKFGWDVNGVFFNWIEADGVAGNNYIRFGVAAAEQMRINASGNVGIGSSAPIRAVSVSRNAGSAAELSLMGNGNVEAAEFYLAQAANNDAYVWNRANASVIFGSNNAERMRVSAAGNVGINTTNPSNKFTVNTSTLTNSFDGISLQYAGTATGFGMFHTGSTYTYGGAGSGEAWLYSGARTLTIMADSATAIIKFATGGNTERMRLDASGNLGLGVTPSTSNINTIQTNYGAFTGNYQVNVCLNSVFDGANWTYFSTAPAAAYYLSPAGVHNWRIAASGTAGTTVPWSDAMVLNASGNLGIGTTSPGVRLDVSGSIRATGSVTIGVNGTYAPGSIFSDANWGMLFRSRTVNPANADFMWASEGAVERMRITNAGSVVINNAAVATNATDGFLYIPGCAGTPTGTPTTYTGRVPLVVDTTNGKLYMHTGGAWVALN